MPNMHDIEQQELYKFNLNKAWIAAIFFQCIQLVASIFGFSTWQASLKAVDELLEKDEPVTFDKDMFELYRGAIEYAFYAQTLSTLIIAALCYKFRSLARVFFYLTMVHLVLCSAIPTLSAEPVSLID